MKLLTAAPAGPLCTCQTVGRWNVGEPSHVWPESTGSRCLFRDGGPGQLLARSGVSMRRLPEGACLWATRFSASRIRWGHRRPESGDRHQTPPANHRRVMRARFSRGRAAPPSVTIRRRSCCSRNEEWILIRYRLLPPRARVSFFNQSELHWV